MSLGNSSPSASSSAHSRHQTLASSAPNSRLPSPPPINTMSEGQPTHAAASSSTTSLFTSPSVANSDSPSPSITDAVRSSSPPSSLNGSQTQNGEPFAQTGQLHDVDPQIIEALKSKDRLYVLKLGEWMEGLINDRNRPPLELSPSTSYQRMLVHRCSSYYKLSPETDQVTKVIYVSSTMESKVPQKRIAELVPAETTTQPAFKIMRRAQLERKVKPHSSASSVTGEDADLSDVEPSESGSMGGRSATGGSAKKRMTIEEREAAYKEARSRIFSDYEEKGKDRDMSASSSSLSLASVSASNSGGSVGDVEDSASSLATESERSGPSYTRRSNNISTSSSSRSMRSGFTSNGSSSSRNSRAASPSSFTYASLYDPTGQTGPPYDPHAQGAYPPGPYMYPYPPHPSNAPYPYQFYQYPYSHVPPPSQNAPEGSTSSEMYPPPPPHMMYGPPYMWPPPSQPSIHPAPPMTHQNSNGQVPPGPQSPPQHHPQSAPQQYPQYMPPQGYYTVPGFYTPPTGQPMHHAPPGVPQFFDDTRVNASVSGNGENYHYRGSDNQPMRGGAGNGFNGRNGTRGGHNGGKHRGGAPTRSPWSYGPGIGMGGVPMGSSTSSSASSTNGEAVAPRFNSSMRRTSNTSTGSSGQYRPSSNGDEAASQTSSTSSSSRRTYTSTTSSQHPLPARPDWAVGLKPESALHSSSRHLEHSLNGSRISPPTSLNGGTSHSNSPRPRPNQDQGPHPALQPNDFPPLTSMSSEKRSAAPAVGGAWTNATSRSLLMTPPTGPGNSVVHHPGQVPPQGPHGIGPHPVDGAPNQHGHVPNDHTMIPRLDDTNSFERPPPKATELYNPNSRGGGVTAKRGRPNNMHQGMGRGNFPPDADLALQFGSMSMGGDSGSQRSSTYPPAGLS